jgi:hypothetical protein
MLDMSKRASANGSSKDGECQKTASDADGDEQDVDTQPLHHSEADVCGIEQTEQDSSSEHLSDEQQSQSEQLPNKDTAEESQACGKCFYKVVPSVINGQRTYKTDNRVTGGGRNLCCKRRLADKSLVSSVDCVVKGAQKAQDNEDPLHPPTDEPAVGQQETAGQEKPKKMRSDFDLTPSDQSAQGSHDDVSQECQSVCKTSLYIILLLKELSSAMLFQS